VPENQSQAHTSGVANPDGGPKLSPQPHPPQDNARPSDTEVAHAPEEGRTFAGSPDEDALAEVADQNTGSLDGHPHRDKRGDYPISTGHSGTADLTAGARFADRMPDASRTETDQAGRPIDE
jgi:hypothetical protein